MKKAIWTIILLGLMGLIGVCVEALKDRYSLEHQIETFLYLPNGKQLKKVAMSHEELIADFLFMQGSVYFGKHYREYARGKYQYQWLYQIFDTVTDLDPYYYDAYITAGHLFDSPYDKIKIYEKGITSFPKDWKLYELVGFTYYHELYDKVTAAQYYEKASRWGSPPYIPSLAGMFFQEAGYYDSAIRILLEAAEKTDRQGVKYEFLERAENLALIRDLQVAVEIFKQRQGRVPKDFMEILLLGIMIPEPKLEPPWKLMIDFETGKVITYQSSD
ncbi:hypothetical protein WDW89_05770 [Deltaproteobacteria bacterium TL4]